MFCRIVHLYDCPERATDNLEIRYVAVDGIPFRGIEEVYGTELLQASYAICHTELELV
tara:strand:+ start:680 stop:853 length:174 start_codon:yes stop_codon:yes gene_type:complete